jgi:carbonic anhydrase
MPRDDPLVKRNQALRAAFFENNAPLFTALADRGQSPDTLFISCSDSRVLPEHLTGSRPGDLFVLRNLANVVPPYGRGEGAVGASVEYAVRHLRVRHVVVCGHTDCGGIKALDGHANQLHEPHFARWIEYARSAQTQVDARGVAPDIRHRAIVEQNVLLQLDNLQTYRAVRQALEANALTLHGWVYDLSTGQISYWDASAGRFVCESA